MFPKNNMQDHKENDRRRKFYEDAASSGKHMGNLQIPTDWSRDGRFITFDTSIGEEEREV